MYEGVKAYRKPTSEGAKAFVSLPLKPSSRFTSKFRPDGEWWRPPPVTDIPPWWQEVVDDKPPPPGRPPPIPGPLVEGRPPRTWKPFRPAPAWMIPLLASGLVIDPNDCFFWLFVNPLATFGILHAVIECKIYNGETNEFIVPGNWTLANDCGRSPQFNWQANPSFSSCSTPVPYNPPAPTGIFCASLRWWSVWTQERYDVALGSWVMDKARKYRGPACSASPDPRPGWETKQFYRTLEFPRIGPPEHWGPPRPIPPRPRPPRPRPPGPGNREWKSSLPGWIIRVIGQMSEACDAVEAIIDGASPFKCQDDKPPSSCAGGAAWIMTHLGCIDWNDALLKVLLDQIEDMIYATFFQGPKPWPVPLPDGWAEDIIDAFGNDINAIMDWIDKLIQHYANGTAEEFIDKWF